MPHARSRSPGRHSFVAAVQAMLATGGRVVVMGMGKSGHVGRKVAATLASTGTPAFFVHPAEASHGDLGMVTSGDVVLAISNSGESEEIGAILPAIRRLGVTFVAMTGRADSSLARHADIVISSEVDQEACPLNLAPTASTTAQMALGDALAVAEGAASGDCSGVGVGGMVACASDSRMRSSRWTRASSRLGSAGARGMASTRARSSDGSGGGSARETSPHGCERKSSATRASSPGYGAVDVARAGAIVPEPRATATTNASHRTCPGDLSAPPDRT